MYVGGLLVHHAAHELDAVVEAAGGSGLHEQLELFGRFAAFKVAFQQIVEVVCA